MTIIATNQAWCEACGYTEDTEKWKDVNGCSIFFQSIEKQQLWEEAELAMTVHEHFAGFHNFFMGWKKVPESFGLHKGFCFRLRLL
jgi:hypothetical protein